MTQMTPDQATQTALAHHRAGRLSEAEQIYRQILGAQPNHPDALTNFADVLKNTGRMDDAQAACRRVVALFPKSAAAHCNLGIVLRESGKFDEAISVLEFAISLQPDLAAAHNDLGVAFRETGRLDDAVAQFRRAVEINPNFSQSLLNLGSAYRDQGRNDFAVECYRSAVKGDPGNAAAHSGLIFAMHADPDCDANAILQEAKNWAIQHEHPLARQITPHPNERSPYRRMRIGYLTPDFHAHASTCFLLPLLGHHDAKNVEIVCYSGVKQPDDFTLQFQKLADYWRDITTLSDAQVAQQIRLDQIDILVDLKLHAAGNRLPIFAAKPAPVQVTWLGYPGTSGMDAMDFRLTDTHLDPPGETDQFYTEKSIRLPDTFWCYDPAIVAKPPIDVAPPPALKNGYITFGCLNNFAKINDPVLELWAKVLREIPRSRLILMAPKGSTRHRVLNKFQKSGIDSARIEFVEKSARTDYFKLFDRIDIVLDTFPYTGHTTGFDGIWMGVPFVTLAGKTAVGRGGVSILSNLAMTDWIAENPDQYVAIARQHSNDLSRLSELRAGLRRKMESSALMNGRKFAADVEAAYRQMWREWCFWQI